MNAIDGYKAALLSHGQYDDIDFDGLLKQPLSKSISDRVLKQISPDVDQEPYFLANAFHLHLQMVNVSIVNLLLIRMFN